MGHQNTAIIAQHLIQTLIGNKKTITIMLVGRTGHGKSSTVNSLLGSNIAEVNDDEA